MVKPSEFLKFDRPLWQHQKDALDRFADKSEAALLHEMGTGKTTTAIAWLRAKYNAAGKVLPTLIVSPVATLPNWIEEIKRNAPEKVSATAAILDGSKVQRRKKLKEWPHQIWITNPEAFDMEELCADLNTKRIEIVVIDEAHRFKNFKSKRLKRLLALTDQATYRMILTGTPILNSYLDLWAQWRILDRGVTLGTNFYTFREQWFKDENLGWKGKPKYFPSYVPRPGIAPQLTALIDRKASRVTKAECLDLPPLVQVTEHIEMSSEQAKLYRAMESELIAEVKAGACVAANALTRVLRLLQILSGYLQVETETNEKVAIKISDNPRLERCLELLEELTPKHKAIVWCSFKENYRAIRAACEDLKIGYAQLTGETKDRQAQIDAFQNDPSVRVMIANPQAGGIGINLTAASYAIYYSRSFSLGDRLQSEARNFRGGSEIHEKITHIDLVAAGTLDEDVLSALLRKENFSDSILDKLSKR